MAELFLIAGIAYAIAGIPLMLVARPFDVPLPPPAPNFENLKEEKND